MYTRVLASATRSVLSLHLRCDTRCAVNVNWFGSKCSPGLSASSRALQPSAAYRQVVHGGASRALCVRALSRSLEPYDPFIEPQIPKWNESVGWKYALTKATSNSKEPAELKENMANLKLLIPDLEVKLKALLDTHQRLEALECSLVPGEEGVDMYPAAQAAFANLKQNIGPDFTFSQAAKNNHTSTEWALQEALMSAASNYAGPGSVLLPAPSLRLTMARIDMQKKVLEGHIVSYMSMQVRMALDLGNVSRRLVTLMQECPRGVNLSDMLSTDYNMTCLLYDDKCDQLADELRWMAHH